MRELFSPSSLSTLFDSRSKGSYVRLSMLVVQGCQPQASIPAFGAAKLLVLNRKINIESLCLTTFTSKNQVHRCKSHSHMRRPIFHTHGYRCHWCELGITCIWTYLKNVFFFGRKTRLVPLKSSIIGPYNFHRWIIGN